MKSFALALMILLLAATAHASLYDAPFEDAFITYRYAENFAEGRGLVYNPGELVDGYSSPLWTVLLSGFARAGVSLPAIAPLLSLLFGLVATALAADLGRRLLGLGLGGLLAILPASVWVAHGGWAYYASSGMETSLFLTLLTGSVWLMTIPRSPRRLILAGVLLALSAMTRPEALAYVALLACALGFGWSTRDALLLLVAFAVLFIPYFTIHWVHYGYPFPNTYYAKATTSGFLVLAGLSRTEVYLTSHGYWVALFCCVYLLWKPEKERFWYLAAAIEFGSLLSNIAVGGDAFAFNRFLLPQIPFGALAVVATAQRLLLRQPLQRRVIVGSSSALVWIGATYAVSYLPILTLTASRKKSERQLYLDVRRVNDDYFAVGQWLRDNASANTVIATNAAGIVPYVSRLPTIDMLGLNDKHIAHRAIALGHGIAGHEKHDAQYVLARRPGIILLGLPMLAPRRLNSVELNAWVGQWFDYLPGDRELFTSPGFREAYRPTGVDLANKHLVLFVRSLPSRS